MLLLGSAALLAAVLVGVVWFALAFDPNAWRDDVESLAAEATGRRLVIDGELALTFFPWLGAEARSVRLEGASDDRRDFATADRAGFAVRLWPLLAHRRVEVGGVHVEGLVLALRRRADGTSNWADLIARLRSAATAPGGAAASVAGFVLRDARVHYVNEATGREHVLSDVLLRSGPYAPDAPLDLEAGFAFEQGGLAVTVEARGTVRIEGETFGVETPRLEIKSAPGAHLQVDGSIVATALTAQGADALTVTAPVLELALAGPALAGGSTTLRAAAPALAATLAKQRLSVEEMSGELYGLQLRGSVTGTSILDAPEFTGRVELASFSPKELMLRLGRTAPVTADPQALTEAHASGRYFARGRGVELDELVLALDGTSITGDVTVRDVGAVAGASKRTTASPAREAGGEVEPGTEDNEQRNSNPEAGAQDNDGNPAPEASHSEATLRFALAADRLDLGRYLPPAGSGTAVGRGAFADPFARLQAALGARDAEGTLRVGTLEVGGLRSTDVVLVFHAQRDDGSTAPADVAAHSDGATPAGAEE